MKHTRAYLRWQSERKKAEAARRLFQRDSYMQLNNPFWYARVRLVMHWTASWLDPRTVGIDARTPQRSRRCEYKNVPRQYGGASRQEVSNALDALEDCLEMGLPCLFKCKQENPWWTT